MSQNVSDVNDHNLYLVLIVSTHSIFRLYFSPRKRRTKVRRDGNTIRSRRYRNPEVMVYDKSGQIGSLTKGREKDCLREGLLKQNKPKQSTVNILRVLLDLRNNINKISYVINQEYDWILSSQ